MRATSSSLIALVFNNTHECTSTLRTKSEDSYMWCCVAYGAHTCFVLLYPTILIITVHALALEYLVTFHLIRLSWVTYAYINSMITT